MSLLSKTSTVLVTAEISKSIYTFNFLLDEDDMIFIKTNGLLFSYNDKLYCIVLHDTVRFAENIFVYLPINSGDKVQQVHAIIKYESLELGISLLKLSGKDTKEWKGDVVKYSSIIDEALNKDFKIKSYELKYIMTPEMKDDMKKLVITTKLNESQITSDSLKYEDTILALPHYNAGFEKNINMIGSPVFTNRTDEQVVGILNSHFNIIPGIVITKLFQDFLDKKTSLYAIPITKDILYPGKKITKISKVELKDSYTIYSNKLKKYVPLMTYVTFQVKKSFNVVIQDDKKEKIILKPYREYLSIPLVVDLESSVVNFYDLYFVTFCFELTRILKRQTDKEIIGLDENKRRIVLLNFKNNKNTQKIAHKFISEPFCHIKTDSKIQLCFLESYDDIKELAEIKKKGSNECSLNLSVGFNLHLKDNVWNIIY